jgi:hypothetical protein
MAAMIRVARSLLVCMLLAGCAYSPPPADNPCCAPPAPGTAEIHLDGKVYTGVTISH